VLLILNTTATRAIAHTDYNQVFVCKHL